MFVAQTFAELFDQLGQVEIFSVEGILLLFLFFVFIR